MPNGTDYESAPWMKAKLFVFGGKKGNVVRHKPHPSSHPAIRMGCTSSKLDSACWYGAWVFPQFLSMPNESLMAALG